MASKRKTRTIVRTSDQEVGRAVELLKDPRLSANQKRKLRDAAFSGVQTGAVSFSQLCRISRA